MGVYFFWKVCICGCCNNWKMNTLSKIKRSLTISYCPISLHHTRSILFEQKSLYSYIFISPTIIKVQNRQAVSVPCRTGKSKTQTFLYSTTTAGIFNSCFSVFEKIIHPKQSLNYYRNTTPVCRLLTLKDRGCRLSPFSFRYICLWSVVSVTANLTQTVPQRAVIAQEMFVSSYTKSCMSLC